MGSKKPYIQVRTTDEIISKFGIIASKDNRSMSNLGEKLIKDFIEEYEKEHGKIEIPTESV